MKFTLRLLDIYQQFIFVIRQKEQYTNLKISNDRNRCDWQKHKQILNIYKKKSANN